MALQTVRIGSMDSIHQYDDGAFVSGVEASAPIACAAPVNANEALRLGDLPTIANIITSSAVITDHAVVRGDGGARLVQDSLVIVDDAGLITAPGGAVLGGAANRSLISATGVLTMNGTARVRRHIRIAAPSWKSGSSAPTPGFLSVWPILSFDVAAADDEAHFSLICPFRMAAGTAIQATVDWCHQAAADNGTVKWVLEYRVIEPGEDVTGATTEINATSPGNHAQHDLVRTQLGAVGITGAVAHDIIGLRLYRNVAGDTLAVDADMLQVHFCFIMDKLGEPT